MEDGKPLGALRDHAATILDPRTEVLPFGLPRYAATVNVRKRITIAVGLGILIAAIGIIVGLKLGRGGKADNSQKTSSDQSPAATSTPRKLPEGRWSGRSRTTDRGEVRDSPITVAFDQRRIADDACGDPGNIISTDSDTITVNWGRCGLEVVRYVIENGTLSADGATVDRPGLISKKRTWTLSQQ